MNNRLTLNGAVERKARPFDLTGHDPVAADALQARGAEYEIWALPQAGGRWTLKYDDAPQDWTWTCATYAEAEAVLLKMAKTVYAMQTLSDAHQVLRDHLRAPGGTTELDFDDLFEDGDDAADTAEEGGAV